jgi:hypothetical protein
MGIGIIAGRGLFGAQLTTRQKLASHIARMSETDISSS